MNEMMQEIPVLRKEVGLAGLIVVGADNGVYFRFLIKAVNHSLYGVGRDANIGIEGKQDVAVCFGYCPVPRSRGTCVHCAANDPDLAVFGDRRRVVR